MNLSRLIQSITRKEWKKVMGWTFIIIFITTLPIIYGYFNTPNGKTLSGLHALTPIDMNVYYSYLEQVKQGRSVFVDLFTNEPQKPLIFNIFWLSVGLAGKIFKLNNIITFHLARIALIPIFIFVIYLFISYFFTPLNETANKTDNNNNIKIDNVASKQQTTNGQLTKLTYKAKRQTALIFILFSSGVGAILSPILEKFVYETYGYYHWPLDLWVPESVTFLTLFHMPHFIASLTLIILIFLFVLLSWDDDISHLSKNSAPFRGKTRELMLKNVEISSLRKDKLNHSAASPRAILKFLDNKLSYEICAGLCALILFQFHPFHIPTIFGVLGSYFIFLCFINKKILWVKSRSLAILFLFTLPDLIYHLYILTDPIIKQRAMQNVCWTPAPWLTLIGFGFLTPLAILGIYYIFKKYNFITLSENRRPKTANCKYYFLIFWLIIQTLLIYIPFALQRRLSEGLHIALSLLAIIALFELIKNVQKKLSYSKFNRIIFSIYDNKTLLIVLFIILFAFSNFFNIVRDIVYYNQKNVFFYLPIEKKDAFDWIKNNTDNNTLFLANPTSGNFISGRAGRFIYAGHGTESLMFESKKKDIAWFFATNKEDDKKIDFLKNNNIDYIYYSDFERGYNNINNQNFNPNQKDYLKLVYKNNLVEIYLIKKE